MTFPKWVSKFWDDGSLVFPGNAALGSSNTRIETVNSFKSISLRPL